MPQSRFPALLVVALLFAGCAGSKATRPGPELRIELWTTRADATYNIGEPITFEFRANHDCYVTLVDIGTSGEVTILFPNRWHEENFVRGGRSYRVPPKRASYKLEAAPPAGTEIVKIFATLARHDLSPNYRKAGNFYRYRGSEQEMMERDIRPIHDSRPRRAWAEDSLRVRILPRYRR